MRQKVKMHFHAILTVRERLCDQTGRPPHPGWATTRDRPYHGRPPLADSCHCRGDPCGCPSLTPCGCPALSPDYCQILTGCAILRVSKGRCLESPHSHVQVRSRRAGQRGKPARKKLARIVIPGCSAVG